MVGEHTASAPTLPPHEKEAAAAAAYHALLREDEDLARSTAETLARAHTEHGLMIQDRMLCNVMRPRFMTRARHAALVQIAESMAALFDRLGHQLLASDRLLDLAGADEIEREIWQVDPGYDCLSVTSRLDSFMIGKRPAFVEYNAESPAGIGFCDLLSDVFQELPVMRQWRESHDVQGFQGMEELLQVLLWAHREWGGPETPRIAVVDWQDVLTKRDFELCAEYFRQRGYPTIIVDPRRLQYRNGGLEFEGERVTLIYRRVLLHELLEKANEARDLLQAYRDGAVCIVNSPRSKLLHKKSVMALLSDPTSGFAVSAEERRLVTQTVPWTRLLVPGKTTYHNDEIDLERFVLDHREQLVLKPSDDYGGRGVVLGWETAPDAWEAALEAGLNHDYIVQERVPVPESAFPVWDDGLRVLPLWLDTDPLLFRGKLGGILTRVSGSALLNVSAGSGSTAPTFILQDEET